MSETWLQTHSGVAFDLLEPRAEDVRLDDIALALSRINRFAGHTHMAGYNVAQHSYLVMDLMPPTSSAELQLAALLHDAHEAYTGDITTPVKNVLRHMVAYLPVGFDLVGLLQRPIQRAIHDAFGFGEVYEPLIKEADHRALAIEKNRLMGPEPRSWGDLPPDDYDLSWSPWVPTFSARMFAKTATRLIREAGLKPLATLGA